ncbi:basement membrane-specific heparan sulfate proteoglycan core protein isoform X2 [Labrus bergylta]|uniref:basement membrane-specific heparan sulfate proteoglycan core protein isoform X2 n=1 Tax=Labrus bergylta TaxID=56723 RepID=UPI003313FF7D
MSLTAAASGFIVFLLSVPVIQGQAGWGVTYSSTEVCALRGSTVVLRCTYSYPSRFKYQSITVQKSFWFTEVQDGEPVDLQTDSQYTGRVTYSSKSKDSTLTITNVGNSDSAVYKFRFITTHQDGKYIGDPGVTLSLTDLHVKVGTSRYSSSWADLTCVSSCTLPPHSSYIWFKNGEKIPRKTSLTYSDYFEYADSYSCALQEHQDFPSPPVCVRGETCNRVKYDVRTICAPKGSSVDIYCTYNGHEAVTSKFWFSPEHSQHWYQSNRVQVSERESGRSTLRISDLRESDSAQHRFKFITRSFEWRSSLPGTTLTVTDLHVKVDTSRYSFSSSRADLTCVSSCTHSSYIWFKNGEKIPRKTSSSYSDYFNNADSYSCALQEHQDFPSPPVCVHDETCNRVKYDVRTICAPKGSSVDIYCTYNGHEAVTSKFWFSPEHSQHWYQSNRVQVSERERGRSTLRISDLRESDSAQHRFNFTTRSFEWRSSLPGTTLTVTDLHVKVDTSRYSFSSSRADLTCVSSCTHSSYIWFKNGEKIPRKTSSTYSDYFEYADSYSCALEEHQDFPSPPVCVHDETCNRVKYDVRTICAPKGSSVDIYCTYNGHEAVTSKFWFSPEHSQHWYQSNRVQVSERERGRSTLRISDLRESDSAQHRFKFTTRSFEWRSSLPGTTLTVTALQVQVKRIRADQHSIEVEMTCHSNCSEVGRLSYVWFSNKQKITRAVTSTYKGSFSLEDEISCALNGHDRFPSPSVYAPKLPSVSVSPSAEIVENSTVTLTCSSDANPAANYTWYKKNGNPDFQPLSKGPELVFSSVQSSDSGEFYCAAENDLGRRTSEHFISDVKYAPRFSSVSASPSAEIVEGSSVTLTCSSDANPAANYTWYKENQTLLQGQVGIYSFTSISSKDSGIYFCSSNNKFGQRNSTGLHVDVQYAPKLPSVSVSPSAEIMEGSSMNLTCSSDANPAANYTWYKEDELTMIASGQILTIKDIKSEHSGNYYCQAHNSRGLRNSTFHSIVVSGSMKSVAAGSITALFLVIIFLIIIFLYIRKRSNKPEERTDNGGQLQVASVGENSSSSAQRKPAEVQEELCYASVTFSKNQEDPLYSNILQAPQNRPRQRPKQPKKEEEEDYEDVEYTMVKFERASASTESRSPEVVEDQSALYSTVTKKPRV